MHLFWQRGYDATSVADLVDVAGIGRQSLYGAFGDKRKLFEEAFNLYTRKELRPFLDALEGPGTPGERIRSLFDHIRGLAARNPQHGCLAVRTAAAQNGIDAELARLASAQMGHLEDVLTATLEDAMRAGEAPRGRDARALARTTLAAFHGMAATAAILPDPPALAEDVLQTLEATLLGPDHQVDQTS